MAERLIQMEIDTDGHRFSIGDFALSGWKAAVINYAVMAALLVPFCVGLSVIIGKLF